MNTDKTSVIDATLTGIHPWFQLRAYAPSARAVMPE